VRDLGRRQARLRDRLLHRQVGICRRIAHEAQRAAVDLGLEVQGRSAADLATQAAFGIGRVEADAGATGLQAGRHVVEVVAQARHDALAGDDDAPHQKASVDVNRPTFRSMAW
jgi:hypothetical protein